MEQVTGERMVKGLQKMFLSWVEDHPDLRKLDPSLHNDVRKRVFRSTFDAFRLGVTGVEEDDTPQLWTRFFGWLDTPAIIKQVDPEVRLEVAEKSFRTALMAFRIGAMVGSGRR